MWQFLTSLPFQVLCLSCLLLLEAVAAHDGHGYDAHRDLQLDDVPPAQDIVFADKNGKPRKGVRCATGRINATSTTRDLQAESPVVVPVPDAPVDIPVKFHVMTNSSGHGYVSDEMILDQISVLNQAYAGSMFTFSLQPASDILRHVNDVLATSCFRKKNRMKKKYGIDVERAMNVYACDPDAGVLGHSSWPDDYPEVDKRHGVVFRFDTMPGGSSSPYNLGHTLTHEVGHYLGLMHTFDGGCEKRNGGRGDGVSDTPAEKEPAKGCPIGRDTCPQSAGVDPVENYMDYSHDSCMNNFTPGQGTRMHSQTAAYRPTLYYKL
jgi:Pregnancy-associated plasma protein-A